jgi:hypothetical protein
MTYTFKYEGKIVSNNAFYAGVHWTTRNKIKNDYGLIFRAMLRKQKMPKFEKFDLKMKFNSRHDVDNVVATVKIFVDCLKGEWVPDDTKEHFKSLTILHDETLKNNTVLFEITIINEYLGDRSTNNKRDSN